MAEKVLLMLQNEDKKKYIEENALKFAQQYTFLNVKQELKSIYGLS